MATTSTKFELKLGIERGKYLLAEDIRHLSTNLFVHLYYPSPCKTKA